MNNEILNLLNESPFFEMEKKYSSFPIWYYADLVVPKEFSKEVILNYLILIVDQDFTLSWALTNRANGEYFKLQTHQKSISEEDVIDLLTSNEDILIKCIHILPSLLKK